MSYEDIEQSVARGMIGSALIIFLGVSHDGWGKSLGCFTQVWVFFRGWVLLAVIIGVANYLAILWTNYNGGGDGWFGLQNGDDNDDPADDPQPQPRRPSGGGNPPDNPPTPPGKPPSQPKNPSGGGNPPKSPSPQPRRPSPSPSPQRPPSRRRHPTPEPKEPEEDVCMVCGYVHPGGSHQW